MMENIFIVVFLLALLAALAGMIGIGGGVFYTPIMLLIGSASPYTVIPLSNVTILGVAVAAVLLNLQRKRISFRVALILEPFTILGTILGVQLHLLLSELVLIVILELVLIIITVRTVYRSVTLRKSLNEEELPSSETSAKSEISRYQWLLGISGSFIAGMLSGSIGIGGGILKVPVMVELGLAPSIAFGTGSLMVLFTSLSSVLQFLYLGRLPITYAILFFTIGFISSLIGVYLVRYIKKPYQLQFLFSIVLVLATILLFIQIILLIF
ncbi:MAG: sulfite exporter TauE/SafE family protein [Promethearchaeota archaeon]